MWCIIKEILKRERERINMSKIYNVLDVSLYVVNYSAKKETPISNLQLQKILYYIQAMFLVNKGVECFKEDIVRWTYGPVVKEAYDEFRAYGNNKIPKEAQYSNISFDNKTNNIKFEQKKLDEGVFLPEDIALMNSVIEAYRNKEAFELVNKTHSEDPWKKTKPNEIMKKEIIRNYYVSNKENILQ